VKIRASCNEDRASVIGLLVANTPSFFHPSEQKDLEDYMENEVEDYYVVEENDEIIGAGGINYFPEEKTARLSWDIVKPEYQGKGAGRMLTHYRIDHLRENENVQVIVVRTTQLVYMFYEKMGFELIRIEKDFWAEGFDLYQMEMKA
jgi:ribosomal-protein-alanine N-acetyltransferase